MSEFHKITESQPEPYTEVIVLIDGQRGPMWSNNYQLIAFMTNSGTWWEDRHPEKPLEGVLGWWEKPENPNL